MAKPRYLVTAAPRWLADADTDSVVLMGHPVRRTPWTTFWLHEVTAARLGTAIVHDPSDGAPLACMVYFATHAEAQRYIDQWCEEEAVLQPPTSGRTQ